MTQGGMYWFPNKMIRWNKVRSSLFPTRNKVRSSLLPIPSKDRTNLFTISAAHWNLGEIFSRFPWCLQWQLADTKVRKASPSHFLSSWLTKLVEININIATFGRVTTLYYHTVAEIWMCPSHKMTQLLNPDGCGTRRKYLSQKKN